MAAKLTCPECDKTLTLAKAPTPGKKVRCPRCQAVFAVPAEDDELVEEETPAAQKKAAIKKGGPAKPPPKPKSPPTAPPPPKAPSLNEDDESAGTYGFKMTEEEEAVRDQQKVKIDYAPDLTVKDPRGKAVAILAKPSTLLIINGGLIAIFGLLAFSVGIWPFFFSDTVADTKVCIRVSKSLDAKIKDEEAKRLKGGGAGLSKKLKENILKEEDTEALAPLIDPLIEKLKPSEEYIRAEKPEDLKEKDKVAYRVWLLLEERDTAFYIWVIVGSIPIFLYGGVMAFAGVKMQTLESYTWSLVGSVMGIIFGLGAIIGCVFLLLPVFDKEEPGVMEYVQPIFGILYNLGGAAASVWSLRTALDPKIKEAFFFDPEKDKDETEEAEDEAEDEEEE